MEDLVALEQLAGAMLKKFSAGDRRRLLRDLARQIGRGQRDRVAAQRQPDGTPFVPRRPPAEAPPGAYPVRFLYPKSAAKPRVVSMKSWVRQGPLLTGFDTQAGGIRSFFWDEVAKWLPVERNEGAGGKLRRRGRLRQAAMFRKLGRGRYLREGATDREAWIGFAGQASRVAEIHQKGLRDRPSLRSREVRYPKRELLGLAEVDRVRALDLLLDHVAI